MASDRVTRRSDAQLDLIERASRGDADAFDPVIAERMPSAFRLAKAIVGDAHLAEDVVEEAFVSAWRNLPRLREPAQFDGWFVRILVNVARKTARRRPSFVASTESHGASDAPDLLERAISSLSVDQRAALALYHLEGRRVEDVAAVLGTSVGRAQSRLRAARQSLERALAAER
jgi:RNA polymerase sigma-70 factor, ECF subfamily